MSIFFFYCIWTAVSAVGLKYSAHVLLDKDITWLSSILIILSIQWVRLIKYPEQSKKPNVHVKVPQTNSNINKKRNR